MEGVAKTLTASARARAEGPSASSTAAPNASLVASASASPSQLPSHVHSNDDGEPSSLKATQVTQADDDDDDDDDGDAHLAYRSPTKRPDAAPLAATDMEMEMESDMEEEEQETYRNLQATKRGKTSLLRHADKYASGSPSLHTLLDARDVWTDWNVVHYLAALGANAELAAVLSKPQCPIYATDPQGRSPLLVALGRQKGMAAQLLLKAEEQQELPWQLTWETLSIQDAGLARNLDAADVNKRV